MWRPQHRQGNTPLYVVNGGTGASSIVQALTNFGFSSFFQTLIGSSTATALKTLLGLSTPVAVSEGGTGQTTAAEAIGELTQSCNELTAVDRIADRITGNDASADTGVKVPPWAVAGEAVLLSTTFSGSSLDIDFSAYTSIFTAFRIYLRGLDLASDANLFIRLSDDGGSTFEADAADYWWSNIAGGGGASRFDVSDSEIELNGTTMEGSTAGATSCWVIDYVPGAASSTEAMVVWNGGYQTSGGGFESSTGAGGVLVSGTYTDLRILASTGNISGSHTVIGII